MKLLIFAGTGEGRKLVEKLKERKEFEITVCVATEYGKEVLEKEKLDGANCIIKSGRLDEEDMISLMREKFDFVIDATHPYAKIVSENIKNAANQTETDYIRLLRDKTHFSGNDYVLLKDTGEVVEYLSKTDGNVLLAVGSKELGAYSELQKRTGKLFARVLPLENVVAECNQNGFSGKNLICMQGPFSKELNIAMLKQYDCKYLVTKDTGKEGGADEKYLAAKEVGVTLVVVGRNEEEGLDFEEVMQKLNVSFEENSQMSERESETPKVYKCTHFPMFVDIGGKRICILGAGKIARRRIETLLKFDCSLKIVAKDISDDVKTLIKMQADNSNISVHERTLNDEDIKDADILILATNNRSVNAEAAEKAKKMKKIVNVADDMSLCDFYFPGIAVKDDLVCGITAQGRNHKLSKRAATEIRNLLKRADEWEEK